MTETIAAVIVTRNRLALLQECLAAVRAQTRPPDEIIVIDNDSDDGSRAWLDAQDGLTVILQGNSGGAGGFYSGIKRAYQRGHAWFWCMDDDTIPMPDCLAKLAATPRFRDPKTGYLGSIVLWKDNSLHGMNMHAASGDVEWFSTVMADHCVRITTSSFVSIMISRAAVAKVGLPIKEFFIWGDDVEYTARIAKSFQNYYVLDSFVIHKTASNKANDLRTATPGDYGKYSYGLRNQVVVLRRENISAPRRAARIISFLARNTVIIIRRRAPAKLLLAMAQGLFFAPKIEMVSGRPTDR